MSLGADALLKAGVDSIAKELPRMQSAKWFEEVARRVAQYQL
jgi:hypothetical protein